ncbi:hypothetical protein AB205_0105810 [Aquarana catesbeiana]|uniref:Uncharacterized protein n=1 Tax=Aquarana catesbeiana TaxID=8400 RepID=A0A2G9RQR1_AQUCT|nr:hypothetical protein AB205_0105810 [Aquarana catesbeiana]
MSKEGDSLPHFYRVWKELCSYHFWRHQESSISTPLN